MSKQRSDVASCGVTRRDFLKLGAGAGGLLLAGREAWSAAPAAPKLESELVFACNGGGTQTEFEKNIFPEFSKRFGVPKLTYVVGQPADNVAKMRVQKSNPTIDVAWLAGGATYQAIDEGMLTDIDLSVVTNTSLLASNLIKQKQVVPVGVTSCGLLYHEEAYKKRGFAPPTSWWDMWDPKLKGHVGSYSINLTATSAFLVKISMMLTNQYKNVDAAFAKLRELRPNMLGFYTSAGAYETATAQGDLWLQMNTSARAQQMRDSGLPIAFVQPKEGLVGYETWLGAVKGAPHPNVAQAWINYLLSTEVQNKIPVTIGYNPVNREAKPPANLANYFPDLQKVFIPDWRFVQSQLSTWVDRWNKEVER
jgi:putative spermidine/putrescine transport system substrate-binding protein